MSSHSKAPLLPILFFLCSCAIVVPPTGGPTDQTPPVVISTSPDSGQVNVHKTIFVIRFDEYITLKDINGIVLSPPPVQKLKVLVKGRELHIGISELQANTTYKLSLLNAVADLNEQNILSEYNLSFSTGNQIDNGKISGVIKDQLSKQPSANISAGLIPVSAHYDSVPAPKFITRSGPGGDFSFSNLPAGKVYNLIAFEDVNQNRRFDPGEKFAYRMQAITDDTISQELFLTQPAVSTRPTFLRHESLTQHKTKVAVKDLPSSFQVFNLHPAKGKSEQLYVRQSHRDTLLIFDTHIYTSSGRNYILYAGGQPCDTLSFTQDTLTGDSLSLSLLQANRSLEPYDTLRLDFSNPVHILDPGKIRLLKDSAEYVPLKTIQASPFSLQLLFQKQAATEYRVLLQQGFAIDVLGQLSVADTFHFNTPESRDYGSLHLSWPDEPGDHYIIQLLKDLSKEPEFTFYTTAAKLDISELPKGEYYLRVIYDHNQNGRFDPVLPLQAQPEKVLLHTRQLKISSKWAIKEELVD